MQCFFAGCGIELAGWVGMTTADARGGGPAGASDDRESSLEGLRVLVVEDDANNAKLVAVVLRAEDCDVHLARTAEDALTVIPIFGPQVLILDLILPSMSGLELAQRLKADTTTADIVIIAVTASNGAEVMRVAMTAGCAACVAKPIDAFALPALVAHHLKNTPSGTKAPG